MTWLPVADEDEAFPAAAAVPEYGDVNQCSSLRLSLHGACVPPPLLRRPFLLPLRLLPLLCFIRFILFFLLFLSKVVLIVSSTSRFLSPSSHCPSFVSLFLIHSVFYFPFAFSIRFCSFLHPFSIFYFIFAFSVRFCSFLHPFCVFYFIFASVHFFFSILCLLARLLKPFVDLAL